MAAVPVAGQRAFSKDEAVGPPFPAAKLTALSPAFRDDGVVTAANIAAEGDGAAAVLIASPARARRPFVDAEGAVVLFATAGASPDIWPMATLPAEREALKRASLSGEDIDRWEIYESSAAATLAWLAETGVAREQVNPDGGALATTAPRAL